MKESTAEQGVRQDAIRTQLKRILATPEFLASERSSRLLRYLVDQYLVDPDKSSSQYQVGFDVFGKDTDFDPQIDSVVRVQIGRLRQKLEKYYAETGLADEVLIEIRRGCYAANVSFSQRSAPEPQTLVEAVPAQVRQDRQPHRISLLFTVFSLAVAVILVFALLRFSKRDVRQLGTWTAEPFSSLGGQEEFVAISPDGSHLAFSWTPPRATQPQIYLQALNDPVPKRLTSGTSGESRPVWSPDGRSIAYLRILAPGSTQVIIKSLSTGSETRVADLHGRYPWLCTLPRLSWSPDGKKIFTSEDISGDEACSVVAINLAAGSIHPVTQPPPGTVGDLEAAVSPDGTQVAFLRNAGTLGGDIFVTSVEGGPAREITWDKRDIMGFCWMPDGGEFILSSRRGDGVPRLWQFSLDGKTAKPLTDGLTLAAFPSTSSLGDRIAFTAYRTTASIWEFSNGSEKPLISDQSSNSAPQISPNDQWLVYRSDQTGSFELWMSQLDGQKKLRLTSFNGSMVNNPRWSPDGNSIAFECRPQGQSDICLVAPSHPGQARVLTRWTSNEIFPAWSSDGQSIYFTSNHSGQWEIYRQPIAGDEPVAITHDGAMRAIPSVDGRWLYVLRHNDPAAEIVRLPIPDPSGQSTQPDKPKIILRKATPDMLGKWDASRDGIVYLAPISSNADGKETIIGINGDTLASHDLGVIVGPSPPGDLVFSSAADGNSFVYVKQGLKEGNIGFLVLGPQH